MVVTTERDALIASIIVNREDDTVRLVYADWLDEHDEHELAEFIRVSCGVAPDPLPRGVTDPQMWCRERMRHLEELNRTAWSRWPCPDEAFEWLHTRQMLNGRRDLFHGRHIHFRRGFPHAVEVPDMGWVCLEEQCNRCGGMGARMVNRIEVDMENDCDKCHGRGELPYPTTWLLAVARNTTIEEVWVMDRVPGEWSNGQWFYIRGGDEPSSIPVPIFDEMANTGATTVISITGIVYIQFSSHDAARSVAGRAWVEWARKEEVTK